MSKIASKSILTAFALSAIASLAFMAQSGSASAKSVTSCDGGNRRSVIECCETLVRKNGSPKWMKKTGRGCSSSVTCRRANSSTSLTHLGGNSSFFCYVKSKTKHKKHDKVVRDHTKQPRDHTKQPRDHTKQPRDPGGRDGGGRDDGGDTTNDGGGTPNDGGGTPNDGGGTPNGGGDPNGGRGDPKGGSSTSGGPN